MSVPLTADSSVPRHLSCDGLGDRVPIADPGGARLELVRLRAELAGVAGFEQAIRTQAAVLAGFADPSFVEVRGVERHASPPGTLVVIAGRPDGVLLSSVLERARAGALDTTPRVAIAALRQLVPAFARFHERTGGIAHGALAPERVIVAPNGRLWVTDPVFGPAIEQLGLGRRALWRTFRVAAPAAAGPVRLDQRADLIQLGLLALALLAGRSVEAEEFPERVPSLARGTLAAWESRGRPVPAGVATWLLHALQLDPRRSHATPADAAAALAETPAWQIDEASAGRVLAAWAGGETVARVARREQVIRLAASGPAPGQSSPQPPASDLVQAIGDIDPPSAPAAGPVAVPDARGTAIRRAFRPAPPPAPRPRTPSGSPPPPRPAPRPAFRPAAPPRPSPASRPVPEARAGRRRTWLPAVVAAVALAAVAIAGAGRYLFSPTAYGTLMVQSAPRGLEVLVDGTSRGVTPVELRLAAGPHVIELEQRGGVDRRRVLLEAGATVTLEMSPQAAPAPPPAPAPGWLAVAAPFEVTVVENGRPLGAAGASRIALRPGRHAIEIVSEPLGFRETRVVEIRAGQATPATVEAPMGTVHLNAEPWAEVWLDGERIGETPIGNLAVPIGAHEFVFRNPELGEKRYDVSVTLLAPIRLTVDMRP